MNTKSAFISIIGRPNVGKSSLLNAFVGEKVAIVSPKPQTTRTSIRGVLTTGETQLIFIDTPGLHKPRTKLSEYMVQKVNESFSGVDLAVLVTEPAGEIRTSELDLIENIKLRKIPSLLVMNKIDTLKQKELMMQKIDSFSKLYEFDQIVPISVLKRDGVDILLEMVGKYAKPAPHYFDCDDYTDQPERTIIAEIIREKILSYMHDEIPHGTAVFIEEMKERPSGEIVDIMANIFCDKDSHKAMIIGKNGESLKKIATQARLELERFLDVKVNLQCWVKVKPDWRNHMGQLRRLGFN